MNFVTLLIFPLIFLVTKYPYSLDGEVGLIPNMKIFWSVNFVLFLFMALLKTLIFSIKWSAVKNING